MVILSTYLRILILLAVVPGILLFCYIYRLDSIEKEPPALIARLFLAGALSTIAAYILERIGMAIVDNVFPRDMALAAAVTEYFVVVAMVEEGGKFFCLRKITWRDPNFNYRFDAVVYAVSVGLGFAILENIEYAFSYGVATTLVRAVTAVPAHTIFAIFMGHFYGQAKYNEDLGRYGRRNADLVIAYLLPVFLHGIYDFVASGGGTVMTVLFVVFIVLLDIVAFLQVRRYSRDDTPA